MTYYCPSDANPLDATARGWHCNQCQANYQLRGVCDQCGESLERLQACGAVSWFCNHCNQLKSSRSVQIELLRIDA